MESNDFGRFRCDNGHIYIIPKRTCAFCSRCEDVLYDSDGPYMFLCHDGHPNGLGMDGMCEYFEHDSPRKGTAQNEANQPERAVK